MNLVELDMGQEQLSKDIAAKTRHFAYLNEICGRLETALAGKETEGLPWFSLRCPSPEGKIEHIELDLNVLPVEMLQGFQLPFELLRHQVGEDLLTAWERMDNLMAAARPMIQQARGANKDAADDAVEKAAFAAMADDARRAMNGDDQPCVNTPVGHIDPHLQAAEQMLRTIDSGAGPGVIVSPGAIMQTLPPVGPVMMQPPPPPAPPGPPRASRPSGLLGQQRK